MNGGGARGRGSYRQAGVLLLLVVMHFVQMGWLGDEGRIVRAAPDLLLLALLVYAIRATPGRASFAGLIVGLVSDALKPVAFGAGAMAHTSVAFLAAGGKAVFFAENILVSGGFFFAGAWVRDFLVVLASGHINTSDLLWQLGWWSPLRALTTAIVGVIVLFVFRRSLEVRMAE